MNEKVDYIIVGDGFSSLFFAHELIMNKKTFKIFSNSDITSSRVAAGIVNPVVLKRFTNFWLAKEQIVNLHKILSEMKCYLHHDFFVFDKIFRIFNDENEKKTWTKKSKRLDLSQFLDSNFHTFSNIINPISSASVNHSGRLNVSLFFDVFFKYLDSINSVIYSNFVHSNIDLINKTYSNIHFNHIVFCEGISVLNNPFFNNLPIYPNKGHSILTNFNTKIDNNVIYKKKHFLFEKDSSDSTFYYGGSYDRDNFSFSIDALAVDELTNALKNIVDFDFTIKKIQFGFRPSVIDRRPLIGTHNDYDFFHLFNGLGARGVLNASYFARILYNYVENNKNLEPDIDFRRFNR